MATSHEDRLSAGIFEDSPQGTPVPSARRSRFRWYHLYYLLAAFDVLTVLVSLGLCHQILQIYSGSLAEHQKRSEQMALITDLGELAAKINAPGNDCFESRDVNAESKRLEIAVAEYGQARESILRDLEAAGAEQSALQTRAGLDRFHERVEGIQREARAIFAAFQSGDEESAGAHMAAMDRNFAEALAENSKVRALLRATINDTFSSEAARAQSLGRYEWIVMSMAMLIVVAVSWYGSRMAAQMRAADAARAAADDEIRRQNDELKYYTHDLRIAHQTLEEQARELEEQSQQLRHSREEAEQASAAKSQFLANMSHEIRTPMTAILGFSEVLLGSVRKPEEIEAARTIRHNGEHLLQLINDILDISKIESGHMEVEQITCSPRQIVADVASLMRVRAESKGLPLAVEFASPIPKAIVSDPTRLRQILINLVGNAIKFTESGQVTFTSHLRRTTEGGTLEFKIKDSGIGMTPDQVGRLFKPFTQADASMARRFGGSGLGLSISHRLLTMLGGTIRVESEPGRGTTMTVALPVGSLDNVPLVDARVVDVDTSKPPEKPTAETSASAPLEGMSILLVDDGESNRKLISLFLRRAGAAVTTAENGEQAVQAALGGDFGLVLMDMQMPIMDGYTATRRLRAEGYAVAIVALTAHAMTSDRQKCIEAGCSDYVTKPIDREQLIQVAAKYARKCEPAAS